MIVLDDSLRDKAIRAAHESAAPRMPGVTLDQFASALDGCDVWPVVVRGQVAGAVIAKGCELHACIRPEFKGLWMSRDVLRFVRSVIDRFGRVETDATTPEGRAFVDRLGFVRDGQKYVLR